MENLTEPCFVCVTQDICRKRNECVQKDAWATPDDLELLSPDSKAALDEYDDAYVEWLISDGTPNQLHDLRVKLLRRLKAELKREESKDAI